MYFYLLFLVVLVSCGGEIDYVPKPRAFNRIDLPESDYQSLDNSYPYHFEYSSHAYIRPDSSSIAEPYWIHIIYPKFKANVQLTYKSVQSDPQFFAEYIDDAHTFDQ